MSEPRIAVKIVNDHFVSCYPMPEPRLDQRTFLPNLGRSSTAHRFASKDWVATDYAATKEDKL